MSIFGDALRDYDQARHDYREAARAGVVPDSIKARRLAALRRLHALEDPWTECRCASCRVPAL